MKHGSLFSGIGGFDLAAQWMGWENVFHCEWNEFGKRVLNYYWPNTISYHDISETDFIIHRGGIDILTGGFPCQPYSTAGKRIGKADERHLWPEMLRAVSEIQPRWVVGENVRGLTNWDGGVVFDEVQADLEALGYEVTAFILPACAVSAPHRRDRVWFIAYANMQRGSLSIQQWGQEQTGNTDFGGENENGTITNTYGKFGRPGTERQKISGSATKFCKIPSWNEWPTQSAVCSGDDGISAKLDGITFPKWRSESIKAYGNSVVPQVVYQIFKAIEQYETET